MESIFHEKQEGYLCAQHCLNALLQGPYFNAVDLANLAQQMDDEERIRMAESGIDSDEYRHFLEQPSENMDDSGYFSVQVISSALTVWGLELITYSSTEPTALIAQNDHSQMQAYICNYKGHWFTIRKIGHQWFNLNSILSGPQLLSDTYLDLFFAQLLQEGYSIFIVIGELPQCPADDILSKNPVITAANAKLSGQTSTKPDSIGYRLGTVEDDETTKIQKAVAALERVQVPPSSSINSIQSSVKNTTNKSRERIIPVVLEGEDETYSEDDDANLQRALQLSLQDSNNEETDKSLKLRLNMDDNDVELLDDDDEDDDDDDELRKALKLSLECVTAPTTPDPDDLRWRRLAYLGIPSRTSSNEPKLNT